MHITFLTVFLFIYSFIHGVDLDTLDRFSNQLGKVYKYDRQVMDLFDKQVKKMLDYSKEHPSFAFENLLEAMVLVGEKRKGRVGSDVDKIPEIVKSYQLMQTLWDEGNIRSKNLLIAALIYPDLSMEKELGKRPSAIIKEIQQEKLENLSTDAQSLILGHKIASMKKEKKHNLSTEKKDLSSMHGANTLLEKILADRIEKLEEKTLLKKLAY